MSKIIDYKLIEPCSFGHFTECVKELLNDGYDFHHLYINDENEDYLSNEQFSMGIGIGINSYFPIRKTSEFYQDYGYEPNFYGAFIKDDYDCYDQTHISNIAFAWNESEIHVDRWLKDGEEPLYKSIRDLLEDGFIPEENLLSISRYGKDKKGDHYAPKKTTIGQIFIKYS